MKNVLVLFLSVLLFASCNRTEQTKHTDASVTLDASKAQQVFAQFKEPGYFGGSGFARTFMTFIATQNFDMAMKFTSKESIERFGYDRILKAYKCIGVNFLLTQTSVSNLDSINGKNVKQIRCTTSAYATKRIIDLEGIIENDTCKLLITDTPETIFKIKS